MSALDQWNGLVEMAVKQQSGIRLRGLLRMNSPEAAEAMHIYVTNGGACPAPMPEPWTALPVIVRKRHLTGAAIAACNWVDAYTHLNECVMEYIGVLTTDTSWSLPLLHAWCADLRTIAVQADKQLVSESSKPEKVEDVARVLLRAFSVTNGDRVNDGALSKRVGTLEVINQLFRVYFDLNTLRLCSNLTRTVNAPGFIDFEASFPVAHRVTYKYFVGRLHLYEDQYDEAIDCLTYAVERIPPEFEANKRLVLLYLIPAKILRGSLPSCEMLARYNMKWFVDIAAAMRTGDLSLFTGAVVTHQSFFIKKGLYLAVEKMRSLIYRSLCQKLYQARKKLGKHDPHKIRLTEYQRSLKLCSFSVSEDEVECILANLIYNGFVKGYLSHKVGFLVLSTKSPFPRLSGMKSS